MFPITFIVMKSGESQAKTGPLFLVGDGNDIPPAVFDDSVADGKTQPGPLAHLLGGKKGFEYFIVYWAWNTHAGVTNCRSAAQASNPNDDNSIREIPANPPSLRFICDLLVSCSGIIVSFLVKLDEERILIGLDGIG